MTTQINVQIADGTVYENVFYRGVYYRSNVVEHIPGGDLARQIENIRALDIRDDDVYLATYPKSGTHWVWEIIRMLRKGRPEYEKSVKDSSSLEFFTADAVAALACPRVLNCHYPPGLIPHQVITKGVKVVHVYRNPKDVFVSAYHHTMAFGPYPGVTSFKEFFPIMIGRYGFYWFYNWCQYIREWEHFSKLHPRQVLHIAFEELKENPVREIKKIDAFLRTGCKDDVIDAIARACDFRNLKKADAELKDMDFFKSKGPSPMFRKGEVGDWTNLFTTEQSAEMDRWLEENMAGSELEMRFAL